MTVNISATVKGENIMPKPQKIVQLQDLARDLVGDGRSPNLYFVTDQGVTMMVTRDHEMAYRYWRNLASRSPRVECALEDRQYGCICAVEPMDDSPNARLMVSDDYQLAVR